MKRKFHYDLKYADFQKIFCPRIQFMQINSLLFGGVNHFQKGTAALKNSTRFIFWCIFSKI